MNRSLILFMSCVVLPAFSCSSGHMGRVADVDPLGWRSSDPVTVAIPCGDTTARYDIGLVIRTDNSFAPGALAIEIKTTAPDSTYCAETLEIPAPVRSVRRGNFREALIPYRNDVTLSLAGEYVFGISTLTDGIGGVWGVGIIMKPLQ